MEILTNIDGSGLSHLMYKKWNVVGRVLFCLNYYEVNDMILDHRTYHIRYHIISIYFESVGLCGSVIVHSGIVSFVGR